MGEGTAIRTNVPDNIMWPEDFQFDEGDNQPSYPKKRKGYTVIRDTREHQGKGWQFDIDNFCVGMEPGVLKTGDYSLKGYEDIFTIERKASVSEIAVNLSEKRWPDVLNRLRDMKHSFLIAECSLYDVLSFPETSNLPKYVKAKIKMNGRVIIKKICEQMLSHNLNIIWAGNVENAEQIASSLFKRIYESYPDRAG